MRVEVVHETGYDWQARHTSQLEPDAVSRPAGDIGPEMHLVRTVIDTTGTRLEIPDSDIQTIFAEHQQGIADAAKGGQPHPITGEPVPSRIVPPKSHRQLLADHIEATLAHHVHGSITDVRVPGYPVFEKYLHGRLVGGAAANEVDAELTGGLDGRPMGDGTPGGDGTPPSDGRPHKSRKA